MMKVKVECRCGQRYSFDVEPVDGRLPGSVACPTCGADGTDSANKVIASLARETPSTLTTTDGGLKLNTKGGASGAGQIPRAPQAQNVSRMSSRRVDEILQLAKAQKGVLWCVLINIILYPVPFILLLLVPILLPAQMFFIYKLARGLDSSAPILWCLGVIVPLLNLLLLLMLSQRATRRIQDAGFKVGLMGAKLVEIRGQM